MLNPSCLKKFVNLVYFFLIKQNCSHCIVHSSSFENGNYVSCVREGGDEVDYITLSMLLLETFSFLNSRTFIGPLIISSLALAFLLSLDIFICCSVAAQALLIANNN